MTIELLEMPDGANSCTTHLGPIVFKNGTHAKYIDNQDFLEDTEKGFRERTKAIVDLTNVNAAVIAQEKLVAIQPTA
jgi:hypothetical protein